MSDYASGGGAEREQFNRLGPCRIFSGCHSGISKYGYFDVRRDACHIESLTQSDSIDSVG